MNFIRSYKLQFLFPIIVLSFISTCELYGQIPVDGLSTYYPFTGSAKDFSGNGYDAVGINAVLTTDRFGKDSSAFSFNGYDSFIDLGDILDSLFCAPEAKFSVIGWAYTRTMGNTSTGTGGFLIGKNAGGPGPYQWNFTHADGQLIGEIFSDSIAHNYLMLSTPMSANQWFQFAVIFDGSLPEMQRLKLYVNGTSNSIAVYRQLGILGTSTQNTRQHLFIGSSPYGDPPVLEHLYDGIIDDIRIYNRPLEQKEIKSLYHEGGWDTTNIHEPWEAFSTNVEGPVYAGISVLGNNAVYAIASGDAIYRMNTSGSIAYTLEVAGDIRSSSSISYDTTVYIASSDRNLYAFSKDGNSVWPALPMGGLLLATPAIDSITNRLYIGVSNHNFVAVNRSIGTSAWSYFSDDQIKTSAVITGDRKLVFATNKGTLYGFDLNNLTIPVTPTWQIALPDTAPSSFAVDNNGFVYLGTGSGKIFKVTLPANQQPVIEWQINTGHSIESAPVIDANGILYIGSTDSKLYAVNISSGEIKWSFTTSGPIRSTPTISENGNVFVANDNGEVYSLDTNKVVQWYYKTDAAIVSPLLYLNSTLYFGTLGNRIIALRDSVRPESLIKGSVAAQNAKYPMWPTFQGNNQRTGLSLSMGPTEVKNLCDNIPISYALEQNYPNPFNPSTTIKYSLTKSGFVNIRLYNLLGQEVAILVNGYQVAGSKEIVCDLNKMPSGIYFYRMTAGSFTDTKKIVLLK